MDGMEFREALVRKVEDLLDLVGFQDPNTEKEIWECEQGEYNDSTLRKIQGLLLEIYELA